MVKASAARTLVTHLARTAPVVVGSVLLHVGVAMALVATAGGHARAGSALPAVMLDVEVAPVDAPVLEPVRADEPIAAPPAPDASRGAWRR